MPVTPPGELPPSVEADEPETPGWKKALKAMALAARLAGVVAVVEPAAEAAPAGPSIEYVLQTPESLRMQSLAQDYLDTTRADQVAPVLVAIVNEEHAPEKQAEANGLLRKAYDQLRFTAGDIAKELLKKQVSLGAALVLLEIARWFRKEGAQHRSAAISWLGGASEKIASRIEPQGAAAVTASSIAQDCNCTAEQATAVLTYLGFKRRGDQWIPPEGEA